MPTLLRRISNRKYLARKSKCFRGILPDLGKRYQGTNPLYYSVWVCPSCYYADFRGDEFQATGKIEDEAFEEDFEILSMVAEKADFRQPRTFCFGSSFI